MNELLKAGKLNALQVLVSVGNVPREQTVVHMQSGYERFAARPVALKAGGDAYAVRMQNAGSTNKCGSTKLGKVVMGLTTTRGASDAS
jgi:hypothetical protein